MRIAVVGAGITGLAAARQVLLEGEGLDPHGEVLLLEASDRLGGKVRTERFGGTLVETGPDGFVARKPWLVQLCADLGLEDEFVAPGPAAARAWLLDGQELLPFPSGSAFGIPRRLRGLGTNPLLSARGKARAALAPLLGHCPQGADPTVWDAVAARFGEEVATRLVAPLVGGLYGDARRLSLASAMPELAPLLARGGVLRRTLRADRQQLPGPPLLTLRDGLSRLIEQLRDSLAGQEVHTRCPVDAVVPERDRFALETPRGRWTADAVVLAVPAPQAARILGGVAPGAARPLAGIRHPPVAVVLLRYPRQAVGRPLAGAGFLAMPGQGRTAKACTWWPAKWPHLASEDVILRVVATGEDAVSSDDTRLTAACVAEFGEPMRLRGDPQEVLVVRWDPGIPLYEPGHQARVAAAEAALPTGIELAGASYRGVGLPDCVRDATQAARRARGRLAGSWERSPWCPPGPAPASSPSGRFRRGGRRARPASGERDQP
jgi:oxygen-dependent protoporphyrinogen oxidase